MSGWMTREKMDAGSMERMKFIGITGGVGAGKSEILHYLETKDGVKVMLADEIAHELMLPGTECYQKLKDMFRMRISGMKMVRLTGKS